MFAVLIPSGVVEKEVAYTTEAIVPHKSFWQKLVLNCWSGRLGEHLKAPFPVLTIPEHLPVVWEHFVNAAYDVFGTIKGLSEGIFFGIYPWRTRGQWTEVVYKDRTLDKTKSVNGAHGTTFGAGCSGVAAPKMLP